MGNIFQVKDLINKGVDCSRELPNGTTPLLLACLYNRSDCVI